MALVTSSLTIIEIEVAFSGTRRHVVDVAFDLDLLAGKPALDLLDKAAQMVIEADRIQVRAAHGQLLRGMAIAWMRSAIWRSASRDRHRRTPRLQVHHRQDGLVIVACAVVDFAQRIVEQRQPLFALGRALSISR